MAGQFPTQIRVLVAFAVVGLLALPAAASAGRTIQFQRGDQAITVVVKGNPRPSDLRAIRKANYTAPATAPARGVAKASSHITQFCGRSVLSNQNCGNVPTEFPNTVYAEYRGGGTVRVCAVVARANHFYPNGDPGYPWAGSCGNNDARIYAPNYMYSYPNDGSWINTTVVNASPWTHTIWERIYWWPVSGAGVCWVEVNC